MNIVRCEVLDNILLVKRIDPQTQVIDIPRLDAWSSATALTEATVYRDKINHGSTGAKVHEANIVSSFNHIAAQYVTVERNRSFYVQHAKNDMVDALDRKRRSVAWHD